MGRLGKSSLAARTLSRLQDRMVPAVLFKHYDALSLVEVLETALGRRAEVLLAPLPPGDVVRTFADIVNW